MGYNFPRGSVWRQWDLHFHTPDSSDYSDKSVTNEEIIAALCKAEVSVVAVTDHHVMNPERIRKLQQLGASIPITVLPGIEMRSELGGSESIHFIGLFPETSDIDVLWRKIQAHCDLDPSAVARIGDDAVYCDFRDTAELIHQLGGLVSIHAGHKSNSVERITNALPHKLATKHAIAKSVDIFEVGKTEDIRSYRNVVFPAINMEFPLILCSDNHNARQYRTRCPTWIKADPTFLGLQQTCFEPSCRVEVGPAVPDQRPGYKVIDAVRFVPGTSQSQGFSPDWIPLNPHLNSIIGGKSSGKSLLLYFIAKTLQPERIGDVNEILVQPLKYDLDEDPNFGFEVRWGDGHVSIMNQPDESPRPITFIPQTYLNLLAERKKEELNGLVESMLVDADSTFAQRLSRSTSEVQRLEAKVAVDAVQLFQAAEQLQTLRVDLADMGDKKAIQKHAKELKKKLKALREASSFSKEEEKEYERLVKEQTKLAKQKAAADGRAIAYARANDLIDAYFSTLDETLVRAVADDLFDGFDSSATDYQREIEASIRRLAVAITEAAKPLIEAEFSNVSTLQLSAAAAQNQVSQNDRALRPFTKKVGDQSRYEELSKELAQEEKQLQQIEAKEKEVTRAVKRSDSAKSQLMDDYCGILEAYRAVTVAVDEVGTIFPDETLQLSAVVTFDRKRFRANFVEAIDRRTPLRRQLSEAFDAEDNYVFNAGAHCETVREMLERLLSREVSCRSGHDLQDVVTALVADYFGVDYTIIQDGDDMIRMSPGKRGIILFQLYLHLSRSGDPLLIDQPEDNLDNRTVYQELNEFIKNRKIHRQIVMISHNPNLVVSTDSEEVIVANQSGQTRSGSNEEYQFEYVSGSIESSFDTVDGPGVLQSRGIRQHVCEILEGGEEAFRRRESKYGFHRRTPTDR